jgi:ribosomal protein S27AE
MTYFFQNYETIQWSKFTIKKEESMNDKKEKLRKCPWCGEASGTKEKLLKKTYGEVRERRCPNCGKILAAYLADEGQFLPKMRSYQN